MHWCWPAQSAGGIHNSCTETLLHCTELIKLGSEASAPVNGERQAAALSQRWRSMTERFACALGSSQPVSADWGRRLSTSVCITSLVKSASLAMSCQVHPGSHSTGWSPAALFLDVLLHKQYKNSPSSTRRLFKTAVLKQRAMGRGRGKKFLCIPHLFVSWCLLWVWVCFFFLTSLGTEKGEETARAQKSCYEQQCTEKLRLGWWILTINIISFHT